MFLKMKSQRSVSEKTGLDAQSKPERIVKMEKPNIMLIDLSSEASELLTKAGFKVSNGTFGECHKTQKDGTYRVWLSHNLPSIEEKDILIIDPTKPSVLESPSFPMSNLISAAEELTFLSPEGQNYFDPRPYVGYNLRESLNKVIKRGGILITYNVQEYTEKYYTAKICNARINSHSEKQMEYNSLSFIPFYVDHSSVMTRTEIVPNESASSFAAILNRYKDTLRANRTFTIDKSSDFPLAFDKFGEVVSFVRFHSLNDTTDIRKSGCTIILPYTKQMALLTRDVLLEFLPNLRPNLFPDISNSRWLTDKQYYLPDLSKLDEEYKKTQKEYDDKLALIRTQIEKMKESYSFIYGILLPDSFDEKLVSNVVETFTKIGYKHVILPDIKNRVSSKNLQEDIQIRDNNRLTLVETKGLSGFPTESDCNQVLKYMIRRQKEEGRTDVHGIFLVNSERNMPPLDRKINPFTQPEILDSEESGYTLCTTWQLFKAYEAMLNSYLSFSDIDSALHKKGLARFLPATWIPIGKITHVYPKAGTVRLEIGEGSIRTGDTIGYIDDNHYLTEKIISIQVNNEEVDEGLAGQHIGIKIMKICSCGTEIFKVQAESP